MPLSSRFPGGDSSSADSSIGRPRRLQEIGGYSNYSNLLPLHDFSGGGARRQITSPAKLVPLGKRTRPRRAAGSDDGGGDLSDLWNEPPLPPEVADALGEAVMGLAESGVIPHRRADAVVMALSRAQDPLACTCALRGIRAGGPSVGELPLDPDMIKRALEVLQLAYPKNQRYQDTVSKVAENVGVMLDRAEPISAVDDGGGQASASANGVSVIGLDPGVSIGFVPENAQGARFATGSARDAIDTDGYRTKL